MIPQRRPLIGLRRHKGKEKTLNYREFLNDRISIQDSDKIPISVFLTILDDIDKRLSDSISIIVNEHDTKLALDRLDTLKSMVNKYERG